MKHPPEQPDPSPLPADEADPFEQAAQDALDADPFLRERVGEALGGLRDLLPPRALRAAEELFVEIFTEDPIVSGYVERLRPRVVPAVTTERDVRTGGSMEAEPAPGAKAAGGRGG